MIRHVDGAHLTATNKRHLSQMIAAGMERGQSARLRYSLAPIAGQPGRWSYQIEQSERDLWGRHQTRRWRGVLEWKCAPPIRGA